MVGLGFWLSCPYSHPLLPSRSGSLDHGPLDVKELMISSWWFFEDSNGTKNFYWDFNGHQSEISLSILFDKFEV